MNHCNPELTVVVLQQLLSCSNGVPFGKTGRLAQKLFQPDDLPQLAALDPLDVASRIESLANLVCCHPQSWRRRHAILS